jgi:hypothetical protein
MHFAQTATFFLDYYSLVLLSPFKSLTAAKMPLLVSYVGKKLKMGRKNIWEIRTGYGDWHIVIGTHERFWLFPV